mgnify:CR=1 FL=1
MGKKLKVCVYFFLFQQIFEFAFQSLGIKSMSFGKPTVCVYILHSIKTYGEYLQMKQ